MWPSDRKDSDMRYDTGSRELDRILGWKAAISYCRFKHVVLEIAVIPDSDHEVLSIIQSFEHGTDITGKESEATRTQR